MKIWRGYGSEHSYRLVLIGRFRDETRAAEVEEQISKLQEAVSNLPDSEWDNTTGQFPSELWELLEEIKVWDLSRAEIQAMAYDFSVEQNGDTLRIKGDDAEIQGFVKLMIGRSAKVEIFSAHNWTEDGEPKDDTPDEE